jgi:hypothetical protein
LIFREPAVFKTSKLMIRGLASITRFLALALLLFVSGCAAPLRPVEMTIADIEVSRLGFLKDGVTTRSEVKTQLGPPTFSVAKENIWGYRMTLYSCPRHLPGTYWRWFPDYSLLAAIPELHVQKNLDTVLSVTESSSVAGVLVFPYELVLVFDESSRLKDFRVFSFRNWWSR